MIQFFQSMFLAIGSGYATNLDTYPLYVHMYVWLYLYVFYIYIYVIYTDINNMSMNNFLDKWIYIYIY